MPDVKRYFLAVVLNRISNWKYCGAALFPQIWIPRKFRTSTTISPLTRSTFMLWDSLCKSHNWTYNTPLMPLTGHNFFPPGNPQPNIHAWNLVNAALLHDVTPCYHHFWLPHRQHPWINGDTISYQPLCTLSQNLSGTYPI